MKIESRPFPEYIFRSFQSKSKFTAWSSRSTRRQKKEQKISFMVCVVRDIIISYNTHDFGPFS